MPSFAPFRMSAIDGLPCCVESVNSGWSLSTRAGFNHTAAVIADSLNCRNGGSWAWVEYPPANPLVEHGSTDTIDLASAVMPVRVVSATGEEERYDFDKN